MIYILTVRNKSDIPVVYNGTAISKLVVEFVAPDEEAGKAAIRNTLDGLSTQNPFMDRLIVEAMDSTTSEEYSDRYFNAIGGAESLQIDWKEVS